MVTGGQNAVALGIAGSYELAGRLSDKVPGAPGFEMAFAMSKPGVFFFKF